MKEIKRSNYTLLLSKNPCEIFIHFAEEEMHGLSFRECVMYNNTSKDAYIAGFSNYVPKDSGDYKHGDPFFVFINLTRCTSPLETMLTLNHELMHRAFEMYDWDMSKEEEMITWAENETREVYNLLKRILK